MYKTYTLLEYILFIFGFIFIAICLDKIKKYLRKFKAKKELDFWYNFIKKENSKNGESERFEKIENLNYSKQEESLDNIAKIYNYLFGYEGFLSEPVIKYDNRKINKKDKYECEKVIKTHLGVCRHQAFVFMIVLNKLGIQCEYISGYVLSDLSNEQKIEILNDFKNNKNISTKKFNKKMKEYDIGHAWNRILINGQWIYFDVTNSINYLPIIPFWEINNYIVENEYEYSCINKLNIFKLHKKYKNKKYKNKEET